MAVLKDFLASLAVPCVLCDTAYRFSGTKNVVLKMILLRNFRFMQVHV